MKLNAGIVVAAVVFSGCQGTRAVDGKLRLEGERDFGGVRVTLSGPGGELETTTDRDGLFNFPSVLPGAHLVRAQPPVGFEDGLVQPVIVGRVAVALAPVEIPKVKWEYRVTFKLSEGHDRMGDGAKKYSSVTPPESALDEIGGEGWELASTYLEMETAFPNFGRDDYVTGLQPNVRPQRAVFFWKRRARPTFKRDPVLQAVQAPAPG